MRKSLIVAALVALAAPLATAPTATAAKQDKVEICHFRGHIQPGNPEQPDFILDLDIEDYEQRVAECTDLGGRVLLVNGNAVSYTDDGIRRGHEVDVPEE